MARRNAPFLSMWLQSYVSDYRRQWIYNCLEIPYILSKKHPETVHVHGHSFTTPNHDHRVEIFENNFNWSENYGLHFFARAYTLEYKGRYDHVTMRQLNTTMGSIARYILFGNKELCL